MDISGLRQAMDRIIREPSRLWHLNHSKVFAFLHQVLEPSDYEWLKACFGISRAEFDQLERDLVRDIPFQEHLEKRFAAIRGRQIHLLAPHRAADYNPQDRLLYYCVRIQAPNLALDTGVLDGFSSAFILKALRDNDQGYLCSIDLPAYTAIRESSAGMDFGRLPQECEPGWIIPEELRDRWSLRTGPSQNLLLPWLEELQTIDLFYHDSLHTYSHMMWEYTTAWSHLREGGLLLSDDVFWNTAFWVFAQPHHVQPMVKQGMGLLRKSLPLGRRPNSNVHSLGQEAHRPSCVGA